MPSYSLLTTTGKNKEAAALANGTALTIAEVGFGDGDYAPTGGETALQSEIGRKPIHAQGLVAGAPSNAFFDILLDENDGPFVIREAGLFDPDGDMIAIAKFDPPINKPIPSSGQSLTATLKFIVAFSDLENLVLRLEASTAFISAQRQVNTGDGLTGGGDLAQDRTLSLDIDGLSSITGATFNATDDRFVVHDKSTGKPKKMTAAGVAEAIGVQPAIDAALSGSALNIINASDDLNALKNQEIWCDTSAQAIIATLPETPTNGDTISIIRQGAENVTIDRNTNKIGGVADDLLLDVDNRGVRMLFDTDNWKFTTIIAGNT